MGDGFGNLEAANKNLVAVNTELRYTEQLGIIDGGILSYTASSKLVIARYQILPSSFISSQLYLRFFFLMEKLPYFPYHSVS